MQDKECEEHKIPKVMAWVITKGNTSTHKLVCPTCEGLKLFEFQCELCGFQNSYYDYPYKSQKCVECRGIGIPWYKQGFPMTPRLNIPSWRLNIDDATEDEVLDGSGEDFGMPLMTGDEWKSYYANSPWEQKKQKEFQENKEKWVKETLSSPDLAEPQASNS